MKRIIVNADDFGYSTVFNEVILELLRTRQVSSTSVMVDRIHVRGGQENDLLSLRHAMDISVGLHIDFQSTAFDSEITRQHNTFMALFNREPDHIDLHKSTYLNDGYLRIVAFSEEHQIPCRNRGTGPYTAWMPMREDFNGTKATLAEIESWLTGLPDNDFDTIFFHPGRYDPESGSSLNKAREEDVRKIEQLHHRLPKHNACLASYASFVYHIKRTLT